MSEITQHDTEGKCCISIAAHAAKVAEIQAEIDALRTLRESDKQQWRGKCAEVDELNAKVFDLSMRASSLMDKLAKAEATIARLSAPVKSDEFLLPEFDRRDPKYSLRAAIEHLIANRLKDPSDD